jgi:glutaminyl-peptide cyclotransferase
MRLNILLIFIVLSIASCDNSKDVLEKNYSLQVQNPREKYTSMDEIIIELVNNTGENADSVVWRENLRKIDVEGNTLSRKLKNTPLGKLTYSATIYQGGLRGTVETSITRYNEKKPTGYLYEIIDTYPHDTKAYTQGLEFHNDTLYESTGQFRGSSVRKTDYTTGEVIQKTPLRDNIFGEGLTVVDDRVIQLTWQDHYGLVYNTQLEKIDDFRYGQSKQGWGLCHDDQYLYKSDGTDKIWILDPETYEELGYIQPTSNNRIFDKVNELEMVDGEIYANIYQKGYIIIIDPKNGAVTGVINTKDLEKKIGNEKEAEVLNGIAYHKERQTIFLTGKNWDTLFEIKVKR